MVTLEKTQEEFRATAPIRWTWRATALALVAVVIGVFIGWFGAGLFEGETSGTVNATGDALTERQEEMLGIVDEYVAAWQATDGDLAATHMSEDAYLIFPARGWEFSAEAGTLQSHISFGPYMSLRTLDAAIAYDNHVVLTGTIGDGESKWISIIEFGPDLDIAGEMLVDW